MHGSLRQTVAEAVHTHNGYNSVPLLKYQVMVTDNERYGDGAGNTVEENSSVFSLIRMR